MAACVAVQAPVTVHGKKTTGSGNQVYCQLRLLDFLSNMCFWWIKLAVLNGTLQCNRAVVTSKRSFYSISSSPIRDVIGYCFCCGTWLLLCLLHVIVWPVKLDRMRQRIASWLTVLLLCFLSCTSTESQNHTDWRKLLGTTSTGPIGAGCWGTCPLDFWVFVEMPQPLWTAVCSTCWPLQARDRRMGFA